MGRTEQGVSAIPQTARLPLKGFRIISAEQYGAGPYGTLFLAQMGAEVIKIEPPKGGDTARGVGPHFLRDGESLYFQTFNLNKRSLTLDLMTAQGLEVLHRLVKDAHAVANNLRGDVPARAGLTYDQLKVVNPAIVCAHASAYGRDNARAKWPGYDYLMQAEAGFCALTGEPDGPPARMGLSMVDFTTGTQMALGLLAALLDAQRSGVGCDVDVDLLSSAVHQMTYPAIWYMNEGDVTQRVARSAHPSATPSQMFRAADGWMFVMAQIPKFWPILCERIGHGELLDDQRFASSKARLANRPALTEILDNIFAEQPMAHWQALLEGHVPVAPVYELDSALDNPWLQTTGMRQVVQQPDKGEMHVLASPIRIDGQRLPSKAAPYLGQDSEAILQELGYDAETVAKMRQAGVI
jgi:crotonobetainyl-CoA:carnitine CoA-transferase CaiB-like acyl-CoA transferase